MSTTNWCPSRSTSTLCTFPPIDAPASISVTSYSPSSSHASDTPAMPAPTMAMRGRVAARGTSTGAPAAAATVRNTSRRVQDVGMPQAPLKAAYFTPFTTFTSAHRRNATTKTRRHEETQSAVSALYVVLDTVLIQQVHCTGLGAVFHASWAAMFVIELIYKVDLAQIDAHMAAHVVFLKKHYASGAFLVSGRKIPRDGGSSWPSARAGGTSKPSSRRIRFTCTVSPTSGSSSSAPASARTTSRNGFSNSSE